MSAILAVDRSSGKAIEICLSPRPAGGRQFINHSTTIAAALPATSSKLGRSVQVSGGIKDKRSSGGIDDARHSGKAVDRSFNPRATGTRKFVGGADRVCAPVLGDSIEVPCR